MNSNFTSCSRAQSTKASAVVERVAHEVQRPHAVHFLVAEIRQFRKAHPNLGKDKRHVLLAPWCEAHGMALPSASTIG
ncbi:MAG: hypothetical protein ACOY5H_00005, partial [Pseudomonadota bacterium]